MPQCLCFSLLPKELNMRATQSPKALSLPHKQQMKAQVLTMPLILLPPNKGDFIAFRPVRKPISKSCLTVCFVEPLVTNSLGCGFLETEPRVEI